MPAGLPPAWAGRPLAGRRWHVCRSAWWGMSAFVPTTTATVDLSGKRVAYELQGRHLVWRPWVVLISGVGHDRSSWEPVLPVLRRFARVVLIDNHGVGQSDPLRSHITVEDLAADVIGVLDHAGIRRAH